MHADSLSSVKLMVQRFSDPVNECSHAAVCFMAAAKHAIESSWASTLIGHGHAPAEPGTAPGLVSQHGGGGSAWKEQGGDWG